MQLINLALLIKGYFTNLFEREEGQDFFEYLLILAGVSLIILVAIVTLPGVFGSLLTETCEGIETATGLDIDCGGGGGT